MATLECIKSLHLAQANPLIPSFALKPLLIASSIPKN
jgi:hypothetical protein